MYLAVYPADAAIPQRNRLREGALPDVLVDGRPCQAGRIDYFFQANDPHERAPLLAQRICSGSKKILLRNNPKS